MKITLTSLFILCSIVMLNSCGEANGLDKTETHAPAPTKLLNKVSYNETDGVVIITFYTASTDWQAISTALLKEKETFVEGTKFSLVCYNDLANTPDVTNNRELAWESAYNNYRVCALDNELGSLRFAHGVRTDAGREGDWQNMEYYNIETGGWEAE